MEIYIYTYSKNQCSTCFIKSYPTHTIRNVFSYPIYVNIVMNILSIQVLSVIIIWRACLALWNEQSSYVITTHNARMCLYVPGEKQKYMSMHKQIHRLVACTRCQCGGYAARQRLTRQAPYSFTSVPRHCIINMTTRTVVK